MSETCNENTINCNPVLHSEDPRSNWFISNTRNGSWTRTRKYLFSRDVTRMDYCDFPLSTSDWHHLRHRSRDNGRAIGIVSHTTLLLRIIYAWAAIIFGEMPWTVLPYPSGILQWILSVIVRPVKAEAETFRGTPVGFICERGTSQKNLIFILLRSLIKNIERKFVSWNCIDDGNGRIFCSIVEGREKS